MEGRGFTLRNFLNLAIQLRGGCLIDLGLLGQTQNAAGFQNTQNAQSIHIAGVLRNIEGNLNMALCCQVIDFIRLNNADDTNQRRRVGQVAVMQRNFAHQVVDMSSVGDRSTTSDAVNFVSLL